MALDSRSWGDVLVFSSEKRPRSTVRSCYHRWRKENGLSRRCDIPECVFHTAPLVWNGKELPLILDHKNGCKFDNRPENLRYLCPNCDSQQVTKGGGNKGRIANVGEHAFAINLRNGDRDCFAFEKGRSQDTGQHAPVADA